MKTIIISCLFTFFICNITLAQTSIIQGIVKGKSGESIENVTVSCKKKNVISDENGAYTIEIPTTKAIKITFSHPSFKTYSRRVFIRNRKFTNFSPKLTNNLASLF